MSRPDDIPQDVWDVARSAMVQAFAAASAGKRVTDHETIARAIMAERSRAQEAADAALERFGSMYFVQSKGWIGLRECVEAAILNPPHTGE